MQVLFRLFALCLALSWVPVTAHCRMESLGLEMAACATGCHDHASSDTDRDGCELVEDGLYKSNTTSLNVVPAVFAAGSSCPLSLELRPATDRLVAPVERPPEWLPTWHFVRRAAAPAHAPDWLHV